MTPLLRNALKNLVGLPDPGEDKSGRRVTPTGVFILALLPVVPWVMWEPMLPYVLGIEALWVGVWAIAGAGAAWRVFRWGLVVLGVAAAYWFLSNLS